MENKSGEYLYSRIYSELKQELIEGTYSVGDAFPPERSLKERFSTTHITVRNALSRLVEEGYIERFSGKGTFVTYTGTGRKAEETQAAVSGVNLVADSFDPFFVAVLDQIERELVESGISIEVFSHRADPSRIRNIGRILHPEPENISVYFFLETEITPIAAGLPSGNAVLIVPEESSQPLPQVVCDISTGCLQAARFLGENSETVPAYIGDKLSYQDRLKLEGFSSDFEPVAVYSGGTAEGGYQACSKVLLKHPQCRSFFCASDLIASGVVRFLGEQGFDREGEYRIVGFGDSPLSEALGISSIRLEHEKVSQVVIQHILDFKQTGKLTTTTARVKTTLAAR